MGQYRVNDQHNFIVLPRQDVKLDCSGTDHKVYIKVRDVETLDKIIVHCLNIREEMLEESEHD